MDRLRQTGPHTQQRKPRTTKQGTDSYHPGDPWWQKQSEAPRHTAVGSQAAAHVAWKPWQAENKLKPGTRDLDIVLHPGTAPTPGSQPLSSLLLQPAAKSTGASPALPPGNSVPLPTIRALKKEGPFGSRASSRAENHLHHGHHHACWDPCLMMATIERSRRFLPLCTGFALGGLPLLYLVFEGNPLHPHTNPPRDSVRHHCDQSSPAFLSLFRIYQEPIIVRRN